MKLKIEVDGVLTTMVVGDHVKIIVEVDDCEVHTHQGFVR